MNFKIFKNTLSRFTMSPPPCEDYLTMSTRHTLIKMNRIMYLYFEQRIAEQFEMGWTTYVFDLADEIREELGP